MVRAVALSIAALLLSAAPAVAGVGSWSGPQRLVRDVFASDVGIDGAGNVTVGWTTPGSDNRRSYVATGRPFGAFGPPLRLGSGDASGVQVDANEAGDTLVAWGEPGINGCLGGCVAWRARFRSRGGQFGPTIRLAEDAYGTLNSALTPGGDGVLAWSSQSAWVNILRLENGRPAGPVRRVNPGNGGQIYPSIATNDRGDTAVAWDGGTEAYLSYRRAGGDFGPPEVLDSHRGGLNGVVPVTLDADGTATATWARRAGAGAFAAKRRGPGRYSRHYLGQWDVATPATDASGEQIVSLVKSEVIQTTSGPLNLSFDRTSELGRGTSPTFRDRTRFDDVGASFLLDGLGNVVGQFFTDTGLKSSPDGTPIPPVFSTWMRTINRFGPPEPEHRFEPNSYGHYTAVNRSGDIAVLYNVESPTKQPVYGQGEQMSLVFRPGDHSRPRLRLRNTRAARGKVATTASCSEACELSTRAAVAGKRAPRATSRLLAAAKRKRVRVSLGRADRRRLRRAARRRKAVRVALRLRAEDVHGNPRTVRKVIRVRPPRRSRR